MLDYENEYTQRKNYVDGLLNSFLNSQIDIPEPLISAMKYAVLSAGKRIRPIFALKGSEIACGKPEIAKYVAIAIEFVHAYSLVHDDMPCMDNDVLRRGKPTTHVKFGEGMALLAGDGLLSLAFSTILKTSSLTVNKESFIKSCSIFSDNIGCNGMIAGQCVDISDNREYSVEYLHSKKTSALLKAALLSGAAAGGADVDLLSKLEIYAENIGLAFQITDDILDLTGDSAILGKSIGKDVAENKRTFPAIYGLDESIKCAHLKVEEGISAISNLKGADFLIEFALRIPGRNK